MPNEDTLKLGYLPGYLHTLNFPSGSLSNPSDRFVMGPQITYQTSRRSDKAERKRLCLKPPKFSIVLKGPRFLISKFVRKLSYRTVYLFDRVPRELISYETRVVKRRIVDRSVRTRKNGTHFFVSTIRIVEATIQVPIFRKGFNKYVQRVRFPTISIVERIRFSYLPLRRGLKKPFEDMLLPVFSRLDPQAKAYEIGPGNYLNVRLGRNTPKKSKHHGNLAINDLETYLVRVKSKEYIDVPMFHYVDSPGSPGRLRYSSGDPYSWFWSVCDFLNTLESPVVPPFSYQLAGDGNTLLEVVQDALIECRDLALRRKISNITNEKVNLLVVFAEFAQSVNLFVEFATRAALAIWAVSRRDFKGAIRSVLPFSKKALANDYLAFTYGIRPLLSDVSGAAEQLASFHLREAPTKFRGKSHKEVKQVFVDYIHHQLTFERSLKRTVTVTDFVAYKTSSFFTINNPALRLASQLGLTNPASVIWEKIPWSFVVDWFLTIGNYLRSLSSIDGLTHVASYETVFVKRTVRVQIDIVQDIVQHASENHQRWGYFYPNGKKDFIDHTVTELYCRRLKVNPEELPTPRFKNPLSTIHIANAIALFTQLFPKGK